MGLEHGARDPARVEALEGARDGGLRLREHDVAVLRVVHVAPLHPDGQCRGPRRTGQGSRRGGS